MAVRPDRLVQLLRQVFTDPHMLPPALSPPAQLVWLGIEVKYSHETIDAAVFRAFPALTPYETAAAWKAVAAVMRQDAKRRHVLSALHQAWVDISKARGRPEAELTLGTCVDELGIVEPRPEGSRYLNFERLKALPDVEMRRAVIAAIWAQPPRATPRDDRREASRLPRTGTRFAPILRDLFFKASTNCGSAKCFGSLEAAHYRETAWHRLCARRMGRTRPPDCRLSRIAGYGAIPTGAAGAEAGRSCPETANLPL
jgi:hypothetical protein